MFAPAEDSVNAIKEWLANSGIDNSRVVHTDNKGWLAFDASVEEAERLLLAEFYEHEHQYSDKVKVGCDQYAYSLLRPDCKLIEQLDIMFQSISLITSTTSLLASSSHPS